MTTQPATITARDGLALEGAVDVPEGEPRCVVVFCHPHPNFGGTMNAPLLLTLRDHLVGRGLGVVRFNYRGVGGSEGSFGRGEAEIADAEGAIDLARRRFPDVPLVLLGWSFGGAVAIMTAAREDVTACIAIAPAVQRKKDISIGLPPAEELALDVPLLVVIGMHDEQISPDACASWTRGVEGARLVEMQGANHFFWAKYDDLAETVGTFLEEVL